MTSTRRAPGTSCTCRHLPAMPARDLRCSALAEPELLTVPEVMYRLRLGRTAVYDLIRTGRLASITLGRARRIPTHAVHDLITHETEPPQESR